MLSAAPAWAQYSAMIGACRFDAKSVCGGVVPDGGRLAACIKQNFEALGESCQAALVRVGAVRQACATDIEQKCPATRPGAGRILFCVKAHYRQLSEPCRDAIGRAAERNLQRH